MSALSHLKVLDLSRVFAGPWCTQMLADFGAEVVKVEQPGSGDDVRYMGSELKDAEGKRTGERSSFLAMNRNKRSITVDFSHVEGQRLIRRLAERSDVLVENFRVGTLARYGLDAPSLMALNPRLVYCSISGFGQTGPRRHDPAYDAIFQAMSGLMSVTGEAEGKPSLVGYSSCDINGGLYAAVAILIALNHRDNGSGLGQHIDLSLLDAQIASMSHLVMNHLVSGEVPRRHGDASAINCPWQAFDCVDQPLMITIGNNRQFNILMRLLGLDDLVSSERFATNATRQQNRDELIVRISERTRNYLAAQLQEQLAVAGIAASPVYDLPRALADPQVVEREVVREVQHPRAGRWPIINNPIRLSDTPASYSSAPPLLGEHTEELLQEILGLDGSECARLKAQGVI